MAALRGFGALLGRILMAFIFISAGLMKMSHPGAVAGMMANHGIPMAGMLVYVTILTEVGGGLALLAGAFARPVALLLFLFLIPVTLTFHMGPKDQVNFGKNLAIMGGLLMVAVNGGGGWSIDSLRLGRSA